MKKVIIMALVLAGFVSTGFAQSKPEVKKADTTKTMVVKKHKKMHAHAANLQKENKKEVDATNKASSMAKNPAVTHEKSTSVVKKARSTKMNANGKMMKEGKTMAHSNGKMSGTKSTMMHSNRSTVDSTHAYKKDLKKHS